MVTQLASNARYVESGGLLLVLAQIDDGMLLSAQNTHLTGLPFTSIKNIIYYVIKVSVNDLSFVATSVLMPTVLK